MFRYDRATLLTKEPFNFHKIHYQKPQKYVLQAKFDMNSP